MSKLPENSSWEPTQRSLNDTIKDSLADSMLTPQEAATIVRAYEREKHSIQAWTDIALHDLSTVLNIKHDIRSSEYIPAVISSLRTIVLNKTQDILNGTADTEHLQQYLQSLTPRQIQDLAIRSVKWKKDKHDILKQNLGTVQIGASDVKSMIDIFSKNLNQDNPNENSERQKKLKELYNKFSWDLRALGMSVSDFFMKLYIHESGGNRRERTVNIFASSGTWSLGLTQSTRFAYNNTHIDTQYNPFVPEQAIPWSVEYFLLACYAGSKGTWKTRVARALDIYNKWAGGTKDVADRDLLNPKATKRDKYGNPHNYAYKVLQT
jgi:hypothetical protein